MPNGILSFLRSGMTSSIAVVDCMRIGNDSGLSSAVERVSHASVRGFRVSTFSVR